ncbi:MAG TPA: hypothetical protein VKW78_17265 [Terriglobales bacterium]|nr:hypothetical protein [Terriglobales bacterium]
MPIAREQESLLICTQCGHINPATNKFCGNCGNGLVSLYDEPPAKRIDTRHVVDPRPITMPDPTSPARQFATPDSSARPRVVPREAAEEVAPEPKYEEEPTTEKQQVVPISGPSFLGLSSDPTSTSDYLLLDEEPRRGGTFRFLMILAILALIVVGALEWRAIRKMVAEQGAKLQSAPAADQNAGEQPASSSDAAAPAANPAPPNTGTPASTTPQGGSPTANSAAQQAHPLVEMDLPPAGQQTQQNPAAAPTPTAQPASPGPAQPATQQPASPADNAVPQKPDAKSTPDTTSNGPTAKSAAPTAARVEKASIPEKSLTHAAAPAKSAPEPKAKLDPAKDPTVLKAEKYLYGEGIPRNCAVAKSLLQEAADHQNSAAMSHLGAMYATGQCVSPDKTMAYLWFSKAYDANPTNEWLEKNLTMLWRDMSSSERQVVLKAKSRK